MVLKENSLVNLKQFILHQLILYYHNSLLKFKEYYISLVLQLVFTIIWSLVYNYELADTALLNDILSPPSSSSSFLTPAIFLT